MKKKDKETVAPETKVSGSEKSKKTKKINKGIIIVLAVVLVLGAAVGGAAYAGYRISTGNTNLPNVYVGDIYVGGLTRAETRQLLEEKGWDSSVSGILTLKLPLDTSVRIEYNRAGASLTTDRLVDAAFEYGHDSGWFGNLKTYLKGLSKPEDVSDSERTLNEEYIKGLISNGAASFEKKNVDEGYSFDVDNGLMIFRKGAGQIKLDQAGIYELTAQALLARETELSYQLPEIKVNAPDFAKLHEELSAEPADAYYDLATATIVPDVKGVAFEVEEAQKLWDEAEILTDVKIPVELTVPAITAESLEELLFRDKLGSKTTYFWGSTADRINNIQLVVNKINGYIMLPGDEFSYNGHIGQRTEAAGFKPAAAYNNGQVVYEIGGGICQVSSTLYFTTLMANLETVERRCHQFDVGYIPKGLDATVSWPGPDLRFKNNREYPIKIVATCDPDNKALTVEIWGTNLDGTYVEPVSGWSPVYDETYPDVQIGWAAGSWRNIYSADGTLIDRVYEQTSVYDLHDYEINWPEEKEDDEVTVLPEGSETPGENPSPSPEPTPSPEPSDDIVIVG